MKTEAEIGGMHLQAKVLQGKPGSYQKGEEARMDSPLEPSERSMALPTLGRFLAVRTVRKYISTVSSHLILGNLLRQP